MRCIANPQKVAGLLAAAIKQSEGDAVTTTALAKTAAPRAANNKTAGSKTGLAGSTA